MQDLLAGHVPVAFDGLGTSAPQIAGGNAARSRDHRAEARAGAAGRADVGRGRAAGFRVLDLVRHPRQEGHAAGSDRPHDQGGQGGDGAAGHQGRLGKERLGGARRQRRTSSPSSSAPTWRAGARSSPKPASNWSRSHGLPARIRRSQARRQAGLLVSAHRCRAPPFRRCRRSATCFVKPERLRGRHAGKDRTDARVRRGKRWAPLVIRRIDAIPVALPLKTPMKMAAKPPSPTAQNLLVRIEAADGTVGWGEAASAPTMTGDTLGGLVAAVRDHLAPMLVGQDAPRLDRRCAPLLHRALLGNGGAHSAVEMAVLDLIGRATGQRLIDLVGQPQAQRREADVAPRQQDRRGGRRRSSRASSAKDSISSSSRSA